MAARTRKTELNDAWRKRIQTSMLLRRLNDQGLDKIKMSPQAVKAAEILLRKTMPDLKAVEMSGGVDVDLTVRKITREIIRPK
jgi:hypothetical protein